MSVLFDQQQQAETPVLFNKGEDKFPKDDAEYLAGQYAIASGHMNDWEIDRIANTIQQDNQIARQYVADLRNSDNSEQRNKMLGTALEQGDVDSAQQILSTAQKPTNPNIAVEQGVADQGIAHQILTEDIKSVEDLSPESIQEAERLLLIGNFMTSLQEDMGSYIDPEYVQNSEAALEKLGISFNALFGGAASETTGIPSLWLANKMIALGELSKAVPEVAAIFNKDFYMDLVASFINTPTAATKSEGDFGKFIFTGDAGREFQKNLVSLPPEELADYLEEKKNYIKEAIGDNPLRAFSVAWDLVYATSIHNPTESEQQFNIWKGIKELPVEIKDEAGKPILDADGNIQYRMVPNPLYQMYAQDDSTASGKFLAAIDTVFSSGTVQSVVDSVVFDALTVAGIVPGTLKQLGKLKTIVNVMGRGPAASYVLSRAVRGEGATAAVYNHVVSMVAPTSFTDPLLAAAVRQRQLETMDDIRGVAVSPRVDLTPQEVAQSTLNVQSTRTTFENEYVYSFHTTDEGNNFIANVYGSGKGTGGFASQAAAEAWAKQRKLLDYEVINPTGKEFFVSVKTPLADSGFYSSIPSNTNWVDHIRNMAGIGRVVWTPNATSGKITAGAATEANILRGKYSEVSRKLTENLKNLSSEEAGKLAEILDAGKNAPDPKRPGLQGRWFDEDELIQEYQVRFGITPSRKEKEAYYIYKDQSDLNMSLMNKSEYDHAVSLAVTGYKSILPNTEPFLARIVPADSIPKNFLAKLSNGGFTSDKATIKALLADPDVQVFQLYGDLDMNGRTVTHIIGKKGEFKDVGLPKQLLDYTGGGTRMYQAPFFLKGRNSERVFTLGAFSSKAEGAMFKQKIDSVKNIYKQFRSDMNAMRQAGTLNAVNERALRLKYDAILQPIDARFRTSSIDDMIKNGFFSPDIDYHVLYDRQSFPGQGGKDDFKFVDTNLQQKNGRLWYSNRGSMLFQDGTSNPATLINPFEALTKQMNHAAKMAGFSDFALQQMHSWVVKYHRFMTDESKAAVKAEQIFMEGKFPETLEGMTRAQMHVAEAERAHIKRVLGHPDAVGAYIQSKTNLMAQNLAEYFGDKKWAQSKFLESVRTGRIADANVIDTLRGVAYIIHMGLLNASVFVTQVLGATAAVGMHPLYGAVAAMETLIIQPMFSFGWHKNSKAVDRLDKTAAALKYLPAGEIKKAFEIYEKTGLHNIRGTITEVEGLATVDRFKTGALFRSAMEKGLVFFNEGERFARITSFGIARRIADEEVLAGRLIRGSDQYISFIRAKTNDLTLGMMAGMEAAWSKNPLTALGMQMLQYPMKVTEIFLGLNKQISTKEKLSFMASQALLWGAYGIPGGPQMLDWALEKFYPEATTEERKLLFFAGVDAYFRNELGLDTSFASKMGVGDFHYQMINELTDKGIFTFLGGVVFGDFAKLLSTTAYVGPMLMSAWSAGLRNTTTLENASQEALLKFAGMVSSFSNYRKAYVLEKYGQLLNAKGDSVVEMNSKYSAFATALGINSAAEAEYYHSIPGKITTEKQINEDAKIYAAYSVRARQKMQESINDPDNKELVQELMLINQAIGILLDQHSPEDRKKLINRVKLISEQDMETQNQLRAIKTRPISIEE